MVKHTRLPRRGSGKESACQCRRHKRHEFDPWVRKIPWRRKWKPTLAFLPRKFHGQRSLAGYSPWGHKRIGPDWATQHKHIRSSLTAQVGKKKDRRLLWCHLHHGCRTLSRHHLQNRNPGQLDSPRPPLVSLFVLERTHVLRGKQTLKRHQPASQGLTFVPWKIRMSDATFSDVPPALRCLIGHWCCSRGFPGGSVVKDPSAVTGDVSSMPGSETFLGEGNDNSLQYSCLENSMDRGAWQAAAQRVAKSQTGLRKLRTHRHE